MRIFIRIVAEYYIFPVGIGLEVSGKKSYNILIKETEGMGKDMEKELRKQRHLLVDAGYRSVFCKIRRSVVLAGRV